MKTCKTCGHPVTRGCTGGRVSVQWCLVCITAQIMASFRYTKGH